MTGVRKRIRYAQNFLKDPELVRQIVESSNISRLDTVYEIGPGEGIITMVLAEMCKLVVAIEIDPALAAHLKIKLRDIRNVRIVTADFLTYNIKGERYKVFSNIPFNATADIIRKLLADRDMLTDAYLILQKEAAEKFAGTPRETQFSVLTKPWFQFTIERHFRRTDFEPVPSVEVVLLHIAKRHQALVSTEDELAFRRFIAFGFGAWKKDLKITFKKVFTYEQWKRLSSELGFPLRPKPTELTFEQWLGLFDAFLHVVPGEKRSLVFREALR